MLPLKMNGGRCMAICTWLVRCLLFITAIRCEAQGNLIPNPSFEEADTCAVQLGFLPNGKPLYWEPIDESPDYFRSCVPAGSVNSVPLNAIGFQYPQEGDSYAGMAAYLGSDLREMFGVELNEPLVIGQAYYGSFWANAGYGGPQQMGRACNNTGMLFTMSAEPWEFGMPGFTLRNYAQVHSTAVINDTAGWTLVSGSFVADSAYRYLVIGNHFSNANTTVETIGPGNNNAYVLVDAVCLSEYPEGCPMVTSVPTSAAELVELGPNPADALLRIGWAELAMRRVLLLDALGRLVIEQGVWGSKVITLPVRDQPDGLYHLLLEGDGVKRSRKVVVMH